jgi:DNA-directed RNA polymerase I, II, and III subunit RPABC1
MEQQQQRIRKTCYQMLRDRGYSVPEETDSGNIIDENKKIKIFFLGDKKISSSTIKEIFTDLETNSIYNCILVSEQGITPFAKDTAKTGNIKLETFQSEELIINITEHVLVPKHFLMSEQDVSLVLSKYNVKLSQLPKIQVTDPVARYFGAVKGDTLKIIRTSETAGKYTTYRTVV